MNTAGAQNIFNELMNVRFAAGYDIHFRKTKAHHKFFTMGARADDLSSFYPKQCFLRLPLRLRAKSVGPDCLASSLMSSATLWSISMP